MNNIYRYAHMYTYSYSTAIVYSLSKLLIMVVTEIGGFCVNFILKTCSRKITEGAIEGVYGML